MTPMCRRFGLLLYSVLFFLASMPFQSVAQAALQKVRNAEQAKRTKNGNIPPSHNVPIRGIAFHCCSCPVPCSCMFNAKDVEGCNIVRIFHITDGGYVGKHINGLTIVIVPHPEELQKTSKIRTVDGKTIQARMYLPEGLTKQQEDGLTSAVYENYMNLGFIATERVKAPIKFTPVSETVNPSHRKNTTILLVGYDVEIPHILHIRTFGLPGAFGKPVTADHLSLEEGELWTIGKTKQDDFQAPEESQWHWSLSDTNGSWTSFQWRWYDRP